MALSSSLASLTLGSAVPAVGSVSISLSRPAMDITPIGQEDTAYLGGIQDATATCDIFFDAAHAGIVSAINGNDAASSVVIAFGDGDTFSGNAYVTEFSVTAQAGSVTRANVTFQFTGGITVG